MVITKVLTSRHSYYKRRFLKCNKIAIGNYMKSMVFFHLSANIMQRYREFDKVVVSKKEEDSINETVT